MEIIVKNNSKLEINYLVLNCHVRYVQDSDVNGESDVTYEEQCDGVTPRMPFFNVHENKRGCYDYNWCPVININSGQIINWPVGTTANISYKVCDGCQISFKRNLNEDPLFYPYENGLVDHYEGYVPRILDIMGDGYGDYIQMNVDEYGNIENFNPEKIYTIINGYDQNFAIPV